jgi:hypothetical protein
MTLSSDLTVFFWLSGMIAPHISTRRSLLAKLGSFFWYIFYRSHEINQLQAGLDLNVSTNSPCGIFTQLWYFLAVGLSFSKYLSSWDHRLTLFLLANMLTIISDICLSIFQQAIEPDLINQVAIFLAFLIVVLISNGSFEEKLATHLIIASNYNLIRMLNTFPTNPDQHQTSISEKLSVNTFMICFLWIAMPILFATFLAVTRYYNVQKILDEREALI